MGQNVFMNDSRLSKTGTSYVNELPFPPSIKNTLNCFIEILLSLNMSCTKIVLFGSYARAEERAGSDFDILVLTETGVSREIRGEACAKFDEYGADLIFYTNKLFEQSDMLLVKEIRRDGVLLWQK